jgi:hypothetical protein
LHVVSALALAVATVAPVTPSYAWDRWHHEGGWGGGHPYYNRGCGGCGVAGALLGLGVGVAVGAAIAGSAPPPRPVYAPPPPVYYAPPPPAAYPPPNVYYGY